MIRLPRPNGPAPLALATALLLAAAPPVLAETACYAGKDAAGRWDCACDTATTKALTSLIMGGYSDLQRKASLAECQAWAAERNASAPAPAASAAQAEVPTPEACLAAFDTCRAAGTPDASCIAEYNACEDSRAEAVRQAAVADGVISPEQAKAWADISRTEPEAPMPLPATEPEPAPAVPEAAPSAALPETPEEPSAPAASGRSGRSGSSR